MENKILFSGVKPTGRVHIGNYFGAMRQFVERENSGLFKCYICVVDYHALNLIQNREEMNKLSMDVALDYLAIGLDQSTVSAHTELTWIFDTLVTMPYLMRAHAFKDAEAKNKEINVGTFNYPVLMAADILLYDTDVVPVGQDQKQHIEYTRDIALKFNNTFGQTFKLPDALILENVAVVPGTDGRKMSKSYGNTIPLFATREEIVKSVMSIVTDSGIEPVETLGQQSTPRIKIPKNILEIYKLFKDEPYINDVFVNGGGKYKVLKEALIEDIDAFIKPMREKRELLAKNEDLVLEVLEDGGRAANEAASKKLEDVKKKIGVL